MRVIGTSERRRELMKLLCRRQHETMYNLAVELGVSLRTIQRDVEALSLSEPIYTQAGKYSGGVYIVDGYSVDRMYMTDTEINVLHKLYAAVCENENLLTTDERDILKVLIAQYSKPKLKNERK